MDEPPIAIPDPVGTRGRKSENGPHALLAGHLQGQPTGPALEESKNQKNGEWLAQLYTPAGYCTGTARRPGPGKGRLSSSKRLVKNQNQIQIQQRGVDEYTTKEYGYFHAQRNCVERTFDDSKNEMGLSDYQVRRWSGWHHHHSLVFMVTLYMMTERIANGINCPLLSVRNLRILMIVLPFGTPGDFDKRLEQMKIRHKNRKAGIDRYYENEERI